MLPVGEDVLSSKGITPLLFGESVGRKEMVDTADAEAGRDSATGTLAVSQTGTLAVDTVGASPPGSAAERSEDEDMLSGARSMLMSVAGKSGAVTAGTAVVGK